MLRYRIGSRWRPSRKAIASPPFEFVIVGQGTRPWHKICEIRYDVEKPPHYVNNKAEYSHWYLRECAVYIGEKQ
jgi:hypothetical protein